MKRAARGTPRRPVRSRFQNGGIPTAAEIAVYVKAILDPEVPAQALSFSGASVVAPGVRHLLGPFEGNALEVAAQLSEARGTPFVAIALGGAEQETALRTALALGAAEAVRVTVDPGFHDPLFVARALLDAAQGACLHLFGRQAGDWDLGVTAGLVAGLLGNATYVPLVRRAEWQGEALRLEREAPGGAEVVTVACGPEHPVVLQVTNSPHTVLRLPKVRDMMAANRKPIAERTPPAGEEALQLAALRPNEQRRRGEKHTGSPDELAERAAKLLKELGVVGGGQA